MKRRFGIFKRRTPTQAPTFHANSYDGFAGGGTYGGFSGGSYSAFAGSYSGFALGSYYSNKPVQNISSMNSVYGDSDINPTSNNIALPNTENPNGEKVMVTSSVPPLPVTGMNSVYGTGSILDNASYDGFASGYGGFAGGTYGGFAGTYGGFSGSYDGFAGGGTYGGFDEGGSYGGFAGTYGGFSGSYDGFAGGGTYGGFSGGGTYGGFDEGGSYGGFAGGSYDGFAGSSTYNGFAGGSYDGFAGSGSYGGFADSGTYGGFAGNGSYGGFSGGTYDGFAVGGSYGGFAGSYGGFAIDDPNNTVNSYSGFPGSYSGFAGNNSYSGFSGGGSYGGFSGSYDGFASGTYGGFAGGSYNSPDTGAVAISSSPARVDTALAGPAPKLDTVVSNIFADTPKVSTGPITSTTSMSIESMNQVYGESSQVNYNDNNQSQNSENSGHGASLIASPVAPYSVPRNAVLDDTTYVTPTTVDSAKAVVGGANITTSTAAFPKVVDPINPQNLTADSSDILSENLKQKHAEVISASQDTAYNAEDRHPAGMTGGIVSSSPAASSQYSENGGYGASVKVTASPTPYATPKNLVLEGDTNSFTLPAITANDGPTVGISINPAADNAASGLHTRIPRGGD